MGLLEWLLTKLLPHFDIVKKVDGREVVYLRRFFIRKPTATRGGIYLHHILRSDDDRDPHDHTWDFTTIVLKGGFYYDVQMGVDRLSGNVVERWSRVTRWRVYQRKAEHSHQVKLALKPFKGLQDVWTLVFTGPRRRQWGFHTPSGWVDWRTYLGISGEYEGD